MAYEYFNPDKSDMLNVAINCHGKISDIAREFKVTRETIYQYINRDPVGKSIIQLVRGYNSDFDLDLAENVIRMNMLNYEDNRGLAQRAAEKVLDKKGHSRGWCDTVVPEENQKIKDANEEARQMYRDGLLELYIAKFGPIDGTNDIQNKPETESEFCASDETI